MSCRSGNLSERLRIVEGISFDNVIRLELIVLEVNEYYFQYDNSWGFSPKKRLTQSINPHHENRCSILLEKHCWRICRVEKVILVSVFFCILLLGLKDLLEKFLLVLKKSQYCLIVKFISQVVLTLFYIEMNAFFASSLFVVTTSTQRISRVSLLSKDQSIKTSCFIFFRLYWIEWKIRLETFSNFRLIIEWELIDFYL